MDKDKMVVATISPRIHLAHLAKKDVALVAYRGSKGFERAVREKHRGNPMLDAPEGEIRLLRENLSGDKILGKKVKEEIKWTYLIHPRLLEVHESE